MAQTNTAPPVLPPCNHLQYILDQLAEHEIPHEQIAAAMEPPYPADDVMAYLAGERVKNATKLKMRLPGLLQDIADAKQLERSQINEIKEGKSRERFILPIFPGIPGREYVTITWKEEFLDLVWLSQPELVESLIEEAGEAIEEADPHEADYYEQETMYECTDRSIDDAILEAGEFTRIELPEKRILVDPWLAEQSISLISGWRGVGKTGFGIAMVEAIVRGEPFGPWEMGESVPCLYLEAEMPIGDIQERLRHLRHTSARKSPLYVYSDAYASHLGMPRAHLSNPEWRMKMERILLNKGIKFWVVDNLASVTAGIDENSKKDWDPINAWLLGLRFKGIATAMLHHTGKGGSQRGTSAREDNVDVSITLKRPRNYISEDGARFIVQFEKARVRTRDLPKLTNVEFQLTEDDRGRGVWTWNHTKPKTNKVRVLKMLHEGFDYNAITEETNLTKSRISQIKGEAEKKRWMDKSGKLTQDGFRYVYGEEDG